MFAGKDNQLGFSVDSTKAQVVHLLSIRRNRRILFCTDFQCDCHAWLAGESCDIEIAGTIGSNALSDFLIVAEHRCMGTYSFESDNDSGAFGYLLLKYDGLLVSSQNPNIGIAKISRWSCTQ